MSCNCKHEEEVQTPPSAQDIREYSKECKINEKMLFNFFKRKK